MHTNPCKECIVQSMCHEECDMLEEYIRNSLPFGISSYLNRKNMDLVQFFIVLSRIQERVKEVRIKIFDSPAAFIIVEKGIITRVEEKPIIITPMESLEEGYDSYDYTEDGIQILMIYEGSFQDLIPKELF